MKNNTIAGLKSLDHINASLAFANFIFPPFAIGTLLVSVLTGSIATAVGVDSREFHVLSIPYSLPFINLELFVNLALAVALICYVISPLMRLALFRGNPESCGIQYAAIEFRGKAEEAAVRLETFIRRLGYAHRRIKLSGEPAKLIVFTLAHSRPWLPRLFVVIEQSKEGLLMKYVEVPTWIWRFSRSEKLKNPIPISENHSWWLMLRKSLQEPSLQG